MLSKNDRRFFTRSFKTRSLDRIFNDIHWYYLEGFYDETTSLMFQVVAVKDEDPTCNLTLNMASFLSFSSYEDVLHFVEAMHEILSEPVTLNHTRNFSYTSNAVLSVDLLTSGKVPYLKLSVQKSLQDSSCLDSIVLRKSQAIDFFQKLLTILTLVGMDQMEAELIETAEF